MDARLFATCQDFEAVMLRPLLADLKLGRAQHMDLFDDRSNDAEDFSSGDVTEALFVDALAAALARAGGIGLARELTDSLEKLRR